METRFLPGQIDPRIKHDGYRPKQAGPVALRNESRSRAIVSAEMSRHQTAIKSIILGLAVLSLSACASGRTTGEHIADMPHWMGGLPADAPPRRNSPEFDEWMAKRAHEAARPKIEQQQPK